jgi:hypothetical protein
LTGEPECNNLSASSMTLLHLPFPSFSCFQHCNMADCGFGIVDVVKFGLSTGCARLLTQPKLLVRSHLRVFHTVSCTFATEFLARTLVPLPCCFPAYRARRYYEYAYEQELTFHIVSNAYLPLTLLCVRFSPAMMAYQRVSVRSGTVVRTLYFGFNLLFSNRMRD